MLANFLIGLREGLEAALIIGILVAYLIKTGRQKAVGQVLIGVGAAIAVSVAVGLILNLTVTTSTDAIAEAIAGTASVIAVGFVTWMVFWMKSQSAALSADLRKKLDAGSATTLGVVTIAFVAVVREGVETSIFLWSAARATSTGDNPIIGAVLGLLLAATLG